MSAGLCAAGETSFPSCVPSKDGGSLPTFTEVVACQREARARFAADYEKAHRKPPSPKLVDRFDYAQRREAREFALRHPDRATVSGVEEPGQAPPPKEESFFSGVEAALKAAKDKLAGALQRAKAMWSKNAPAPKADADEERGVPEEGDALESVFDQAKKEGVDVERVRREVEADPAGAAKRIKAHREQEIRRDMDPGVKDYLGGSGE